MKKALAALDYTFMFDPAATWQHAYQFEQDLADFFAAHGMEADKIRTVDGGVSRRVLYIQPIQVMFEAGKTQVGRPKETKRIINDLRGHKETAKEKQFKQGTLVPSKGYIKRG